MKKISNIILWSYVAIYFMLALGVLIYFRIEAGKTPEKNNYSIDDSQWQEALKLEKFTVIKIDNHSDLTLEDADDNYLYCNSLDSIKINLINDTLFVHTTEGEKLKITYNSADEIIATDHANIIIVSRNTPHFIINAYDSTNIAIFNSRFDKLQLCTDGAANVTFSSTTIDTLDLLLKGNSNIAVVGKKPIETVTGSIGKNSRISFMPKPKEMQARNKGEIIYTTF